jgi:drug/metabolite transporter (DMT)-like permease
MKKPTHLQAILLGILITVIWSTSWVLITIGLKDIPALTFAGLRYALAAILLVPLLFKKDFRQQVKDFSLRQSGVMLVYGFTLYFVAQGGQYGGLAFLPSVTVVLILNLTSLFVALFSNAMLKEKLTSLQWTGVLLNLVGVIIYFNPFRPMEGHWMGWLFAILGLVGNTIGALLGRQINKESNVHPIVITAISMLIGSAIMLVTGIAWQGLPPLSMQSIWIIVILAVINTAVCFTLWNYIQRTLLATETSIINNTMIVYVAILAWIFMGEKQTVVGIIGLILAMGGAMLVQIKSKPHEKKDGQGAV